jgi:hypothetical protein
MQRWKLWIVVGQGFVLLKKIMLSREAAFAGEGACGPQTIFENLHNHGENHKSDLED